MSARAACLDEPCFANRFVGSGGAAVALLAGEEASGARQAGARCWRQLGFTGGKGGCDLPGINSNIGTKIINCMYKNAKKQGIKFSTALPGVARETAGYVIWVIGNNRAETMAGKIAALRRDLLLPVLADL